MARPRPEYGETESKVDFEDRVLSIVRFHMRTPEFEESLVARSIPNVSVKPIETRTDLPARSERYEGQEIEVCPNGKLNEPSWNLKWSVEKNAYKFIGGSAYLAINQTSATTTATGAYAQDAVNQTPSLTVPFDGSYRIEFQLPVQSASAGLQDVFVGVAKNGSTFLYAAYYVAVAQYQADNIMQLNPPLTLAKGDVLTMILAAGTASSQWTHANYNPKVLGLHPDYVWGD